MKENYTDHGDYIELNEAIGKIKMIKEIIAERLSWEAAKNYIKGFNAENSTNWRLPAKEELKELFEHRLECGVKQIYNAFWSSSAEECRGDGRWVLDLNNGEIWDSHEDEKHCVLYVR